MKELSSPKFGFLSKGRHAMGGFSGELFMINYMYCSWKYDGMSYK